MKSFTLPLVLILFFTSCITSTHVHYSDPNYLNSDQFSTYDEMTANNKENDEPYTDTTQESTSDYTAEDYYDYSFSSRIKRFHRPMYNTGYYDGIYTDYYWYNNNPFYCGTSIYFGYNWNSPYYSYYSYSPYYSDYYYTPYYYGNYYSYNGYGYNHHHASHQSYYNNNHNAYIIGNRGSLSSGVKGRGVSVSTNSNILSNSTHKTSTVNIRSNNTIKNNTPNSRNYKPKSKIKTNIRSKAKNSSSATIKSNSNRKNNAYSTTKRNNTNYNSNRGNNRSNSGKKSSAVRGKRSAKPRR
jgi:hypothetical protein